MKRLMIVSLTAALVVALTSTAALAVVGSIKNTKHDLSSGNTTYAIKGTEDEVCVFCHTPHNATKKVPLWNHTVTNATFTTYASATIDGTTNLGTAADDPVSVSRLCLSCHDGSVALGAVVKNYSGNSTIGAVAGKTDASGKLISAAALGTDLSNDHPVGITYVTGAGTDLRAVTGTKVVHRTNATKFCQLFGAGPTYTVECASCHAVHGGTDAEPFLRFSNANSELCLTCHDK
ncbi:MAG: cytochrome c3 family protein [Methanocella sp.]